MNGPSVNGEGLRPGSWRVIRLVGSREFGTRFRSKAWRATTAVLLLIVVGMSVVVSLVGGSRSTLHVGVTLESQPLAAPLAAIGKAVGVSIVTEPVPSEDAGRSAVAAGELDALLIGDATTVAVVVDETLGVNLENSLTVLARELATQRQVLQLGGDPAAFQTAIAEAQVDVITLNPPKTYSDERLLLGVVAGVMVFMSLQFGGQYIAQGVVEEKSTRVVELLLSTVRPWELIAGKVVGIGGLGLVQLGLVGTAGLATSEILGTLTLPTASALSALAWLAVWFGLGFFAYALALAAAAALVSRQEDVGGVMMPVLSFLIVGYVMGISVLPSDPENTWMRVLSLLPPFAPAIMPIRQAVGSAPVIDVVVSVTLMVATIPALAWLSGRIYRNAVMRTGARVRLRDALRAD